MRFISIVFMFVSQLWLAQQKNVAKFIISDATANGKDVTEAYTSTHAYIALYEDDGGYYMANVMRTKDTQSFGRIYDVEESKTEATKDKYESLRLTYRWRYINTYNSRKGTALVSLELITKPQGVIFICVIIPENLDKLVYRGYVEGTLNYKELNK